MDESTDSRIEHAALNSFARLGYHASSVRGIAAEAEVQPASLYHWYPSKHALLVAIMRRFLEGLHREVVGAVEERSGAPARLAAGVWSHVVYHGANQRAAFVSDTELRALEGEERDRIVGLRDGYQRIFEQLIRDGVASGELHCRDAKVATNAILLQCTGVAAWYRPAGALTLSDVADLHVELVLRSLDAATIPSGGSSRDDMVAL
jgi:AcrR family transcriptional regulator